MEDFGSQELGALDACLRHVEDADAYVLILGAMYGTTLPGSDYSFTHLEYEHAQKTGTPVLAYVQQLPVGEDRDPSSVDFLRQVRSSHLLEYSEFVSAEQLIELVRRDLERLNGRLARPKFARPGAVADTDAYSLGTFRKKVLRGAPFPVTLVDAGAITDTRYRPEKRGRLGSKVESIGRIASGTGALLQVFNDFPIKQKGDLVKLRADSVSKNAKLIVIMVGREAAVAVTDLFANARGERAVFIGDWFGIPVRGDYVETFSDEDLSSCELRASVLELIEDRINHHVAEQVG